MGAGLAAIDVLPETQPVHEMRSLLRASRTARWLPTSLRLCSHAAIWAMALVPAGIQMADGWRSTRDDAMISIGSYQVFSAKFPLVGVWSQASEGMHHAFYNLGPLLFWLLAVPVRLDPGQGALWGAALLCAAALSVAVEAVWSVEGWPAAIAVALAVADLSWRTEMFERLSWNPYFGLVFLVVAVATAWVVATGRFGWWPATVFFASVSAQSHLVYAVSATAVAVLAPATALALGYRPGRRRWLAVGIVVAAICWTPPLIQEVSTRPGNLSLVLRSDATTSPVGLVFGWHALATAATPNPIWLTGFPFLVSFEDQMPHYLRDHSSEWGVLALFLLVAIAVAAWRTHRRRLSALAVITLVLSAGTVVSFAAFPTDNLGPVGYLAAVLWVVGMLIWITVAWAAVEFGIAARWWRLGDRGQRREVTLEPAVGVASLILLLAVGIAGLRTLVAAAPAQVADKSIDMSLDSAIAGAVADSTRPGHVAVAVEPSIFVIAPSAARPSIGPYVIDYWGVAMLLLEQGWQPALKDSFYGPATHLSVPDNAQWPEVVVRLDPSTLKVTGVRRIPPPPLRT